MGKLHGEKRPIKQATTTSFTPSTGWVSQKQYVGTLAEVEALAVQIKNEKTDDDAGTPPTVSLSISPIAGGLATLDISYDDDIGTGVEFATWQLQSSDYEKNIFTHPTIRALAINCPTEYKLLRKNVKEMAEEQNYDDIIAAEDCTKQALTAWKVYPDVQNQLGGGDDQWGAGEYSKYAPTSDVYGAHTYQTVMGNLFSVHSVWIQNVGADKAFTCTVPGATLADKGTWVELGSACCAATKIILSYFRDGIEAYIISQYVLRKTIVMPTSTKDIYGLANVNKRLTPWMMENKEGTPAGLKFAMPDYGEWLKKAPNVQYQRNKMTIEQEYWHAEDWNDYIYARALY